MTKVSPFDSNQAKPLTNNNTSFTQEKTDRGFSRGSSYNAAIQDNKLALDKEERCGSTHHDHDYHD
ncbi:hypothetical protein BX616_007266, partial [Lobosporangium transversale]